MKARILFLDDEPQTSRRLKAALENDGYVVCAPKTAEEAFHEINLNGAELLVHTAHHTKTHWDVCDAIFAQHPQFPSLHFATGPASEDFHSQLKGAFHHRMRHLIPEKEFLKKVRKLIFLGRLSRENAMLKRVLKLQKSISSLFTTLELPKLKNQIVEFFMTEFKAKNVIFMNPGSYGFYLQEMYKVTPLNLGEGDNRNEKHAIISTDHTTEKDLTLLFTEMAQFMPSGWELRKNSTYVEGNGRFKSFCIVPLVGPTTKKIIGYVLMVEPQLFGDPALNKAMPHFGDVIGRHLEQVLNFADAKNLSYIDDVTDLYNQRYLKLVLDKEIARAGRTNTCFSVLFMDIDHFKRVNDTRGHIVGSRILHELSKILTLNIRSVDYGFRYGGDEFLLVLVGTNSDQAFNVAERIRKQVEATVFDVEGVQLQVTLSIGIATYPDHARTKEEIIEIADRAMYCGKNKSRNVVYVAS